MKISNILTIITELRISIQRAFRPTLLAVLKSPTLIFHPRELSREFFYHVWKVCAPGTNPDGDPLRSGLISPYAQGLVLDIGAGKSL